MDNTALSAVQGKCRQMIRELEAEHDKLELDVEYVAQQYDALLEGRKGNTRFSLTAECVPEKLPVPEHYETLGLVSNTDSSVELAGAVQAQILARQRSSDEVFAAYDKAKLDLGLGPKQQANEDRRYGIDLLRRMLFGRKTSNAEAKNSNPIKSK